jgi:hypothetical protein
MKYVRPPTVRDLDRQLVVRVLIENHCNVTKAAKALGVPSYDLRRLTYLEPSLIDLVLEEKEQWLDQAEANIREALFDTTDKQRQFSAACFVLNAPFAADRGFSRRYSKASRNYTGNTHMVVGWPAEQ